MREASWIDKIRAKRRAKTLRAMAYIAGLLALWLVLTALGVWAWVHVFHRAPPSKLIFDWYMVVGVAVIVPLGAFAPLVPMKGKDPEIMAADEFFKGPKGN